MTTRRKILLTGLIVGSIPPVLALLTVVAVADATAEILYLWRGRWLQED